jgi:acyl-CoA thioesterase-1
MKSAMALILALLSLLPAWTAWASPVKRILVLGDSLSEGLGLKPSQAYPALLTQKLRAAHLSFEVTNASASGGTTEDGLRRLPAHLKSKIDIFILELGINDVFRGVPVGEIRRNLQTIIDQVKARDPNVRIILCGMRLPNETADGYVFAFSKMYSDLAAKDHAALVPYLLAGVAGDPSLNLPDGIHPNAAGQRILAENVWRVLKPIAREVSAAISARERAASALASCQFIGWKPMPRGVLCRIQPTCL